MKSINKKTVALFLTFFFGATFAYFVWLLWRKLTEWVGDADLVLWITGFIVIVGILLGFLSFKKVAKKFM